MTWWPQNKKRPLSFLRGDGFTLMIVQGQAQRTRRVHVPRWALAGLCCGWLCLMLCVAWLGFQSAGSTPHSKVDAQNGARVATGPVPTSRQ